MAVDGQRIEPGSRPGPTLIFSAPPASGLELSVEMTGESPLEVEVASQRYGLPELPGSPYEPRPPDMMAIRAWTTDSTFRPTRSTWPSWWTPARCRSPPSTTRCAASCAKLRLGLFERPQRDAGRDGVVLPAPFLEAAREAARQSVVLLENDGGLLPLAADVGRVAVIGPLADAPHEQLGTWTFDGHKEDAVTPRAALEGWLGDRMTFAPGLATSRTRTREGFAGARAAAADADVVLFFGGEEAILSGEAHSRADLRLPGAQEALIAELAA
ncbi:MAG TPA: glycoside hydrolase family 3 C-terminal domain-containing protein, partial [Thermoanaerobaculia bacterium]